MSKTLKIDTRKVFPWVRGLHLEALSPVQVWVPAEILSAGTGKSFGSLVELSDENADIGVKTPNDSKKPIAFIIFLKPGDKMRLTISCEIVFRIPANDNPEIEMKVLEE